MGSWRHLRSRAVGALTGIGVLGLLGAVHATGTDVAAKVGNYEIRVSEVEKRLAQVPLFQLKTMGSTPEEIRKRFVEELVELEIMVQGAKLEGLQERPEVDQRIRSVLVSALLEELAKKAAADGAVTDEKIRAYYEANADRYQPQERIMIWQIAVKTKAEAEKLLAKIESDAAFQEEATFVDAWDKLARENSVDKSTYMRKGNLGFVHPDGSTHHKDVKVPRSMYVAASKIKDGSVYPEPVQVESFWVIIARRGSSTTPHRTLESERDTIRQYLAREHVLQRRKDLIEGLRNKHVHEKNERVLEQLTITDDEVTVSRRPGALRQARDARSPGRPAGKPGSLR